MLGSIGAAIYRPLQATSSRSKPWQIAAAVALGVAAGVLLNQSILGLLALGALFLLPVHYPVVVITALGAAGCVGFMESTYGSLGVWCLSQSWVVEPLASFHQLPLVPWFRLNNTVVMGAAVIAVLQLVPMHFIAHRFFVGCKESLDDQLYRNWQETRTREQVLQGEMLRADLVSQRAPLNEEEPDWQELKLTDEFESEEQALPDSESEQDSDETASPEVLQFTSAVPELSQSSFQADTETFEAQLASDVAGASSVEAKSELEDEPVQSDVPSETAEERTEELAAKLQARTQEDLSNATADEVAARAAELAELVDEMLAAIRDDDVQAALTSGTEPGTDSADNTEVRRDYSQSPLNVSLQNRMMPSENQSTDDSKEAIQKLHSAHADQGKVQPPEATAAVEPVTLQEVAQHEEALRYLLHHLKELKNKV